MLIEVTADDIREGVRISCKRCPIALAMSRALRKPIEVGATVWGGEDSENHPLPIIAKEFIRAFDKGYEVHPFSFEVNE